ncbi:hypothetical protein D3874_22005 [Oleomonas cavernae]|uniref:Uncharacterized protein n=1 Tax=Oleomonas cavernae TaxID=2320859 RepID=A0A418WGZ7_9PROT|nr:hypothetical protein D3874_22005 [Oleomonas cavernae]
MSCEHFDVLVVGAGLSGVGTADRLQTECPNKSHKILDGRPSLGGTGTSSTGSARPMQGEKNEGECNGIPTP